MITEGKVKSELIWRVAKVLAAYTEDEASRCGYMTHLVKMSLADLVEQGFLRMADQEIEDAYDRYMLELFADEIIKDFADACNGEVLRRRFDLKLQEKAACLK